MKAEYTIFQDGKVFWFAPKGQEADIIDNPDAYRAEASKTATKLAACRLALADARSRGASEIHLHGMGSTTSIKREAKAAGIKPFVYHPSISTLLAR